MNHPGPTAHNRRAVRVVAERRAFFTPKTLAQYLALSERTVRDMLARKPDRGPIIPSYLIQGSRRVDPADVDAYLARCKDIDARSAA